MACLLINSNISQNQQKIAEGIIEAGIPTGIFTPCTYKDVNLFIDDLNFNIIFVEISNDGIQEGLEIIHTVKQVNPVAKIVAIIYKKDSDLILNLINKGVNNVLTFPFEGVAEIRSTLEGVVIAEESQNSTVNNTNAGKIITVNSYKGGTGVSTIVSNLAFCLSELEALNKKVAIIDLANQSNHCARLLGVNFSLTVNDLAQNINNLSMNYILAQSTWVTDNLALIGSSLSLDHLIEGMDLEKLILVIKHIANAFDYVIIDLPTHIFDARFLAAIELSDLLVVTSTLDITSITDTQNYLQLLKDLGFDLNKSRILVNRYDAKGCLFETQDLERAFEHPVSFYIHNDYTAITEASQKQMALIESNPQSIVAEDIADIAVGIDGGLSFVPIKKRIQKKNNLVTNVLGMLKNINTNKKKINQQQQIPQAQSQSTTPNQTKSQVNVRTKHF